MTRRLLPATIVDQRLYVERPADKQLDGAIDDMGRPPYILVARQMGKTNLLINMKRRREQAGDVVAYFDLTLRYDSPRAFFRSLIDGVVETAQSFSARELESLDDIRRFSHEPIVEYERSLRVLLKSLGNRKLVVVLDEVDSLIKVSYSDIIFSHVRSIYFLRVNHQEYWRLTYVLSGVADPSVIIKDRNISPFNIGERIYLTDFTRSELATFISNSRLPLDASVVDEIFRLTGGQPRMCWDVCAQLEEQALQGVRLSDKDVLKVVERLYLDQFDTPPVDHIRTLVEEDHQLRSALLTIHEGGILDAGTRTKLYLAGISRGGDAATPAIKNPVIEAALSAEWLRALPAPEDSILSAAREAFGQNNFQLVVDILSPHHGKLLISRNPRAKQELGLSLFFLGKSKEALPLLRELAEDTSYPDFAEASRYYLGLTQQRLAMFADSIVELRQVAIGGGKSAKLARLALMTSLIAVGDLDEADQLAQSLDFEGELTDDNAPLVTVSYFNRGRIAALRHDREKARHWYERALSFAPALMVPAIQLQIIEQTEFTQDKMRWLGIATKHIVDGHLQIGQSAYFDLSFQPRHLLGILDHLIKLRASEEFDRLLAYALSAYGTIDDNSITYMLRLVRAGTGAAHEASIGFLVKELAKVADIASDKELDVLRLAAEVGPPPQRYEAVDRHIKLATRLLSDGQRLKEEDLLFLLTRSASLVQGGRYSEAQNIVSALSGSLGDFSGENGLVLLVLRTHEMAIAKGNRDRAKSLSAAREILSLTEDGGIFPTSDETVGVLASARSQAEAIIDELSLPSASRGPLGRTNEIFRGQSFGQIGRNDLVVVKNAKTGNVQTTKFKRVSDGLISGEYTLERKLRKPEDRTRGRNK